MLPPRVRSSICARGSMRTCGAATAGGRAARRLRGPSWPACHCESPSPAASIECGGWLKPLRVPSGRSPPRCPHVVRLLSCCMSHAGKDGALRTAIGVGGLSTPPYRDSSPAIAAEHARARVQGSAQRVCAATTLMQASSARHHSADAARAPLPHLLAPNPATPATCNSPRPSSRAPPMPRDGAPPRAPRGRRRQLSRAPATSVAALAVVKTRPGEPSPACNREC
eukprot:363692-Chlamydomonas_euryale.AAC.8